MVDADDRSWPDPFSHESVVLRRITDYTYLSFEVVMAAQREPGTVVGFAIVDLTEVVEIAGMRGLADVSRFIGDIVFAVFPEEAKRSYLAPSLPFLFVPRRLDCDLDAAVREVRTALAGGRLQLTPSAAASLEVAVGTARFDGDNADDAVIEALVALNEDLRRISPVGHPAVPEGRGWKPHFPPDYLP